MKSKVTTRFFAMILSMVMVINMIPMTAFAEEEAETPETATEQMAEEESSEGGTLYAAAEDEDEALFEVQEENTEESEDAEEMPTVTEKEEQEVFELADETEKEEADTEDLEEVLVLVAEEEPAAVAFEQSKTIDGVEVTVKAEAGILPEDAVLSVEKVPAKQQEEADKAVEEVRDDNQNVAVSYTFDIKVLDTDGNGLQPKEGQKVEVSFALEEATDKNLDANIYHITEEEKDEENVLTAEKLETVVDENTETVKAETDGFSLYTVEFTYNDLQYAMQGDGSVALSEILNTVGLTGEAENVTVSNDTLLSVSDGSGEWLVTALQAFHSEEWMKVTIGGIDYEITVKNIADPESESEEPSVDVDVKAVSKTNNIVGDVFSNQANSTNEEGVEEAKNASLEKYPLDNHDLSYYGDSLRVRYLEGGDKNAPNYLVYRESYSIFSEEESKQYTVKLGEDGLTAYVTPAISAEDLQGKTGIVFLGENVAYDNILVFEDVPIYDGDTMIVPLKKTEDIWVNELFSDGHWVVKNDASGRPLLRAGISWDRTPSGTNWSGEISNFSASWPTAKADVDVWNLSFGLSLELKFSLDFKFKTTGATTGRETKNIATLSIPVELFNIDLDYNLQVEFDKTPIEVEGTLTTDFEYTLGVFGANIKNFKTPVKISKLTVLNESDYNKDINFYIGSQLAVQGGFLSLKINLYIFKIDIGPILSLNMDCHGGCCITARHEKDSFSDEDISVNLIHTCAREGEKGCLELKIVEKNAKKIYFKIDLYFDDWSFNLSDSGENIIGTDYYYSSYTFGSGMKEGICPHKLYKVPVAVWFDDDMTRPAANMTVTVSDTLDIDNSEKSFTTATTNNDGKASLYLPYKEKYLYTFVTDGVIGGQSLAGSKRQVVYMQEGENRQVDIIVKSDAKVTIKTNVVWNVDVEKKDVPTGYAPLILGIFSRKAATDDQWHLERTIFTNMDKEWKYDDQSVLPKFGFDNGQAYFYEYRVRVMEEGGVLYPITPEEGNCYILRGVEAYDNAAGKTEQSHGTQYYIGYDEKMTDDTAETTITATAVMNLKLNKLWQLTDPDKKPESVYLALLQKPESGWEDKANEKKVPNEWVTVLNPLAGETSTLKSLGEAEVLTTQDNLVSIENTPLAIGEVNDDHGWGLTYIVPKYRNGIQMQYQGCELDNSVIENLLRNEYDVNTKAAVKSFGDFISTPGLAASDNDYTKSVKVINSDSSSENTIIGTVRWESIYDWDVIPDYVELHIKKDGIEITESPIRLNKADYSGQDTWIWTRTLENYDPNAKYSVTEIIPNGSEGPEWVGIANGLNVYNYRTFYNSVQCEVQAVFEDEPDLDEIKVTVDDKVTGKHTLLLQKDRLWYSRYADVDKSVVKDISEYVFEAPEVAGYTRFYGVPFVFTRPGWGNVQYNFTVYYMRQSENLKIHISKEWANTDANTDYPDEVSFDVYRDDEKIAEAKLTRDDSTQEWSERVIEKDADGNNLRRVDEHGHKYVYTIIETPVEGFTSQVVEKKDDIDDVYYTITNTWVGEDYVNVKGKVAWEGDEDKEYLRPETVRLSVINSKEEYVRTVEVPVKDDGTYEARYLPGKDGDGNELTYSVIESHVKGYTQTYKQPSFDEESRTWTCDVTNMLTGYFPLTIKKTVKGKLADDKEEYKFKIKVKDDANDNTPLPLKDEISIKGAGETEAGFLIDENGLYLYSVTEEKGENEKCTYDDTEKMVLIAKITDEDGKPTFKSWVADAKENGEGTSDAEATDGEEPISAEDPAMMEAIKNGQSSTVEFTNVYPDLTIEKKWEIDLENKDKPDNIQVVVQKKKDSKWETVKLVELNDDNNWKVQVAVSDGKEDKAEYRVRELKEETALQELGSKIRNLVKQGKAQYDSWISQIKSEGKSYWDALPEDIKSAADKGYDDLIDKLNATPETLYDKLIEQLGFASAEKRIVYDKDDSDKGDDTNEVTYHVAAYESVLSGGTEDAHATKYKVSYKKDDDTYTITDKAIIEIDVVKRWLSFGVDDDDMPDSVWLVLMCQPKAGALGNAQGLAGAAGIDLGGVLDYEFPVINPIKGGMDPISLISELSLGVDLNIFKDVLNIPKLAIGKTDKDKDWKIEFVDSKYTLGIPMEYKGAELSSEIIRQIIKYLGVDLPVSYNPFDNYISIPTKAVRSIDGITNPEDLLDFSKLSGAALNKAKSLTMDDLKNFGWSTVLTDYHLMANVINIKIDWDDNEDPDSDPNTLEGTKTWKGDKEEDRPDMIKIHIKDGDEEVEGSPIELKKSDFGGKDIWEWKLELDEDADEDATYVVSEEWPENYEYKDNYTVEKDGLNLTNTWHEKEPDTITISGQKIWKDEGDRDGIRPEKIIVHLLADGKEMTSVETSKAGEWKYFFGDQPRKNDKGGDIKYTVTEDTVEGYENTVDEYNIINTHKPETINIEGTKTWDDADDQDGIRPDGITVNLMKDGEKVKSTMVEADDNGDWKYTFEDVPKNENGTEITYTVEEEMVEGYDAEVTGYDIKNSHTPETVTVAGAKTWDDSENQDGKRPDNITLRLKADGKEVDSATVTEDDGWKWSFADLPKFAEGKEITYTITEDTVKDYTSEVEGYDVTNTHTPGKTQVNVTKVWQDENDKDGIRPSSVTIRLLADGEDTGKMLVLSEANNWSGSFTGLDANKSGKDIAYTIEEQTTDVITGMDGPGSYACAIEGDVTKGYTVTNSHTPATIKVEGSKTWDDADDRDGKRPESITIRLKADGKEVDSVTVTEADGWKWSFADLPKFAEGNEITYTITEDVIADYTSQIDGFDVTNHYTPGKTQVNVTKVWADAGNHDAIRPENITIRLLADGVDTGKTVTVSADDKWTAVFGDLDAKKNGADIAYTVEEVTTDVITGTDGEGTYAFAVRGDATKGYTVTNTHTPVKVRVEVKKVWDDAENQDGIRPASITVKLLAGGEDTGKAVTLSEDNRWKSAFTGLNKLKDGAVIEYTAEETKDEVVTGTDAGGTYGISISGDTKKGFTITNTHTPETIKVEGRKTWADNDDQDGARPKSIIIRLKADGKEVDSATVTEDDGWKWSFADLPKFAEGKEITYTITEDTVKDYTSEVEGYDVTNTHTPGKTQVNVTKVWQDENDKDGIRPSSVTIRLLADGEDTGKFVTLSADNEWTDSFTDLDAMKDTKEIKYTVEEVTDGKVITGTDGKGTYAFEISGDAKMGFTVTNTHTPETMPDPGEKVYRITYKLNGGSYDRSTADIIEKYKGGTVISIHEKPVRDGYTFLYWKGSEYQPGDKYTVTEDHTFVAQWKKNDSPTDTPDKDNPPTGDLPHTGDNSRMMFWLVLMILSAAGLFGTGYYKKKRLMK